MLLSILIPSVFERGFTPLIADLHRQIENRHNIDLMVFYDHRHRSIGAKRQVLLDQAQGQFITCLDDDDGVAPDYIAEVSQAIQANPNTDVIVFNSQATLNGGTPFIVRTGMEYENEQCRQENGRWIDIRRKPWHWCCWRAGIARKAKFPDAYIDEDWFWIRQMLPELRHQVRIDRVLHYYNHDSRKSLAHQGQSVTDGKELLAR
jgi:glycosyltransferase involved in cell wall biosynthesis